MLVTQTQIVIRVTKLRAVHVCRVSSTSGCSGVAQGLLLLYRHDHVDVNFIILTKNLKSVGMTPAKVKEQDGMTLAKVKEQDGMTLAKVRHAQVSHAPH